MIKIKEYNKVNRRLPPYVWDKIEKMIKNKSKSITQISQFYGISRHAIYMKMWRDGVIQKKEKDAGFKFIIKFRDWLKKI
jgi:Zn-dependent peptidase ImmA (M78 family)